MPRQYTQEELDNDVPELDHIYAEHRREQLKDIILDEDEDEDEDEEDFYAHEYEADNYFNDYEEEF